MRCCRNRLIGIAKGSPVNSGRTHRHRGTIAYDWWKGYVQIEECRHAYIGIVPFVYRICLIRIYEWDYAYIRMPQFVYRIVSCKSWSGWAVKNEPSLPVASDGFHRCFRKGRLVGEKGLVRLEKGTPRVYFPIKARARFSAASMISRSPGPLSLMPHRCRMPWIMTRCSSRS